MQWPATRQPTCFDDDHQPAIVLQEAVVELDRVSQIVNIVDHLLHNKHTHTHTNNQDPSDGLVVDQADVNMLMFWYLDHVNKVKLLHGSFCLNGLLIVSAVHDVPGERDLRKVGGLCDQSCEREREREEAMGTDGGRRSCLKQENLSPVVASTLQSYLCDDQQVRQ